MAADNQKEKELREQILSKRQQIEFDRNNLEAEQELSPENRETPDVAEEAKNFDDSTENVVDTADLKALKSAENELNDLLKQLEDLRKN